MLMKTRSWEIVKQARQSQSCFTFRVRVAQHEETSFMIPEVLNIDQRVRQWSIREVLDDLDMLSSLPTSLDVCLNSSSCLNTKLSN
jgi:hypothetical protein